MNDSQPPAELPDVRASAEPVGYLAVLAIAGAAYPPLTFFAMVIISVAMGSGPSLSDFDAGTFAMLAVLALVGAVIASVVGVVTLPIAFGLARTLVPGAHYTRTCAFAGGLAGIVLLCGALTFHPDPPQRPADGISAGLTFLLGPGLATPLFQFAGACGEWPREGRLPPRRKWQFSVRQILIAMVWIALGMTLLRFTGLLDAWVLNWLAIWTIYQGLTLLGVLRFCEWRFGRVIEGGGGDGAETRG